MIVFREEEFVVIETINMWQKRHSKLVNKTIVAYKRLEGLVRNNANTIIQKSLLKIIEGLPEKGTNLQNEDTSAVQESVFHDGGMNESFERCYQENDGLPTDTQLDGKSAADQIADNNGSEE